MRKMLVPLLLASASCIAPAAARAAAPPVFDAPNVTVPENGVAAQLAVNKSARSSSYSRIEVQTVDGTAKAGVDYQPVDKVLTVSNNTLHVTVPIPIIDNKTYQGQRSFAVRVLPLRNAQVTGSYTPTSVTITDDEVQPPPPTPCPDGTIVPASQACPTGGLAGEQTIADNFDISGGIDLTWTNPRGGIAPPSSDPVGSFRMFCTAGQVLRDDPIVYPGQPGASPHLHQNFGNTGANGNSTYQSLRTTGGTTCGQSSAPINRSAYWVPAMLNGKAMVVKPDFINVYYKRDPKIDPMCNDPTATTGVGQCVDLPNGLRFVFGHNMKTMTGGPADLNSIDSQSITIQCWAKWDGSVSNGGASGYYHTFDEARAAGCVQPGAQLLIIAAAPNCWDGKNLDSADHRSHIANSTGPMLPTQMFRACTPDHPYVLPNLEVQIHYTIDQDFADGLWALDSDIQEGQMLGHKVAGGTTWHMDYWEAWSPAGKGRWHANCIDKHLTCSEGDLGDGYQIVGSGTPNGWWPTHQLVPVP
jgi:hypothetical protein